MEFLSIVLICKYLWNKLKYVANNVEKNNVKFRWPKLWMDNLNEIENTELEYNTYNNQL